jgi:hypothetical protein
MGSCGAWNQEIVHGYVQQQFTGLDWSQWVDSQSEVGGGGYQSVLSCIVSKHTNKQTYDFMRAVIEVIYRGCKSVRLIVICSYELLAFNKSNYHLIPVSTH